MERFLPEEMKSDFLWQSQPINPPTHDPAKILQAIEAELRQPKFAAVDAEWRARRSATKKDPNWYSLFGGPKSIQDMARHLEMLGEYEFFYRHLSDTVHAGAGMSHLKGVVLNGRNEIAIFPLRYPQNLQTSVMLAISFSLRVGCILLQNYAPSELPNFGTKYRDKVQQRFMSLKNAGNLINL